MDIATPRAALRVRLPAARERLIILIGIIGNTQGVKFSRKPPSAARASNSKMFRGSKSKSNPKKDAETVCRYIFIAENIPSFVPFAAVFAGRTRSDRIFVTSAGKRHLVSLHA